jgi:hypothetical protein
MPPKGSNNMTEEQLRAKDLKDAKGCTVTAAVFLVAVASICLAWMAVTIDWSEGYLVKIERVVE